MKTIKFLSIAIIAALALMSCTKTVQPPVEATSPLIKTFTIGKDSTITISVGTYQNYILGMVKTSFPVGAGFKTGVRITDNFQNSQAFLINYPISDNHQGNFTGEDYLYGLPTNFQIFFDVNGVIKYIDADKNESHMHEKR